MAEVTSTIAPLSALTRGITPHFAWPFRLAPDGTVGMVDQDTVQEQKQAVALALTVPAGSLIDLPAFGAPDPTFQSRMPAGPLEALVRRWEPRISAVVIDEGIKDRAGRLGAQVTGATGG